MRWQFVSYHAATPEGTAAGRQLWAVGEGLRALGHDVQAWSWGAAPPAGELAQWCEWRPLPVEPLLRSRARSLLRPRSEVARARWTPPPADVYVADDPASWQAVAAVRHALRVSTTHFGVGLDRTALRDRSPARLQDLRAERRAVRQADVSWALSDRVARAVHAGVVVPPTIPIPDSPLPPVDAPVVGMLADWRWPPNVTAAAALLRAWPKVREQVPAARLLLAGRGRPAVAETSGVEWLGEVPASADLLQQLAVFAFPCGPTSGPKMKVLDAMAHGVAVLTTRWGVEGVAAADEAAAVCGESELGDRLIQLLIDPIARATLAQRGRDAILQAHTPELAARARLLSLQGVAGGDATER